MSRQEIYKQYIILLDRWIAYSHLAEWAPEEYRPRYAKRYKETYAEFYAFYIAHYDDL